MSIFLVAIDFSARGDRALARGLVLADAHGARLVLAHFDPDGDAEEIRARLDAHLRAALPQTGAPTMAKADLRAVAARPGDGAPRLAAELGADLMIIGAHGRHELVDLALSSTGEKILRAAPCPLLVAAAPVTGPWRAGLAAVSFSPACEAAIVMAARIAPDMPVDAVHAVHVPGGGRHPADAPNAAAIAEARARMAEFDARPAMPPFRRSIVSLGGVRGAIRAAQHGEDGAGDHDLVILGAHPHSRLRDFVLGSIAQDMLRDPPCDLLIVRG